MQDLFIYFIIIIIIIILFYYIVIFFFSQFAWIHPKHDCTEKFK